jgi:two-component system phosphate regulon response regulator PhoB
MKQHISLFTVLATAFVVSQNAIAAPIEKKAKGPVKVFILAGQSNMEGQAVVDLTTTEFKLLATLMENDKAVHTRSELLREVWGYSDEVATRTLDTHVKRLREKLGDAGRHIVTIRGTGYQFCVTLPDS